MSGDLFEEHSAILEAAEEFVAAIKRHPRIPMEELSRKRVKLSTLVRRHRATEERCIFEPLVRAGGVELAPHLKPFVQQMMQEKARYSEHIRKWAPQTIERDWEGYVAATEALLAGMKRAMRVEEEELYPAVLSLPGAAFEPPRHAGRL